MRVLYRSIFLFLTLIGISFAQGLGNAGTIQGQVVDQQGAVVPGATVKIENKVNGFTRSVVTGNDGRFILLNLPPNPYHTTVTAPGFATLSRDIDVNSSVPVNVSLPLAIAGSQQTVTVEADGADLIETGSTAHVDVDAANAERIPTVSGPSQLSNMIQNTSPGVAADSNGFFHPLGDHAQANFVVDNQSIADQQSRVYANQISADAIQSMEIVAGMPPAEYGDKTSLVAVIVTKSGLGLARPTGKISLGYGSFGTPEVGLSYGVGSAKFGNYLTLDGMRSGRYLDTPEFRPLHDIGNNGSLYDRIDWQASSKDTLHLNLFGARSWFQQPNTYDQQASGQDQRQKNLSFNIAPGWTHLFGNNLLLTANAFMRQDRVQYYPSANLFSDQPATIAQGRRLTNFGGRFDISAVRGIHNIKAGFQASRTNLSENFALGLTDPTTNPVCVDATGSGVLAPGVTDPAACARAGFTANPDVQAGLIPFDLTRGGTLFHFRDSGNVSQQSAYLQDQINWRDWNLNVGARVDHYAGIGGVEQSRVQPRVGAAYHVKGTNTVLRGSYGQTMETPYNENLLLSSATGQGGLAANVFGSTVNTPLKPGIRNQFNAGFEQAFGKWAVIDADYFWKFTHNAYDFNTLLDTPIAFPIAWNKSKIDGVSMRIALPEIKGFRVNTVIGHTRARYFNPEVGGLFFDQNPPTGVFRIDHDQAFQQSTNLQYEFMKKRGAWAGFTWRYDSGLVAGAVPDYATALTLTADQQQAIGLFCGSTFATLTNPITSCSDPNQGATRLKILAPGTENDDKNPPRIAPRNLFDLGLGVDNVFATDRYKWGAKVTVVNLTNHEALYNFLSTFSGTHFVTPRSVSGQLTFTF